MSRRLSPFGDELPPPPRQPRDTGTRPLPPSRRATFAEDAPPPPEVTVLWCGAPGCVTPFRSFARTLAARDAELAAAGWVRRRPAAGDGPAEVRCRHHAREDGAPVAPRRTP